MNKPQSKTTSIQQILERKKLELTQMLRDPDGMTIEKSADQMDEIQLASERDLAILSVDRGSNLLGEVKAALIRAKDGSFGFCVDCDGEISPKRIAAVPWAARCIHCQETFEKNDWPVGREFVGQSLDLAA